MEWKVHKTDDPNVEFTVAGDNYGEAAYEALAELGYTIAIPEEGDDEDDEDEEGPTDVVDPLDRMIEEIRAKVQKETADRGLNIFLDCSYNQVHGRVADIASKPPYSFTPQLCREVAYKVCRLLGLKN